jgi:hypothetical protein
VFVHFFFGLKQHHFSKANQINFYTLYFKRRKVPVLILDKKNKVVRQLPGKGRDSVAYDYTDKVISAGWKFAFLCNGK